MPWRDAMCGELRAHDAGRRVTVAGIGTYSWKRDTKDRLAEVVNPFAQSFRQEFDKDGKKK